MPKVKVELNHEVINGQPITFIAPCDSSEVTGLKVSWPGGTKEFAFKDSHGNNLTGISELFLNGAYVRVIVDTEKSNAYIQNADTNAYLEAQLASKRPNTWTPTAAEVGARPNTWMPTAEQVGARPNTWTPTAEEVGALTAEQANALASNNNQVRRNNYIADVQNVDLNNPDSIANRSGYFDTSSVNCPPNTAFGVRDVYFVNAGFVIVEARCFITDSRSQIWRNTYNYNSGGWLGWSLVYDSGSKPTPAEIGAAPAGYGWGEYPLYPEGTNIDKIPHKTCAVRMDGNPLPGVWIGSYTTVDDMSGYLRMVAMNGNYKGCIITRTRLSHVWEDWEWEYPPFDAFNVEYRTTERFGGKIVYAKRIHCGALPSAGNVETYIEHGTAIATPIRIFGKTSQNITMPCQHIKQFWFDHYRICVCTEVDMSHITFEVTLYYTKD